MIAVTCAFGARAEKYSESVTISGDTPWEVAAGENIEFDVDAGVVVTVTRVITGGGAVVKKGAGTLALEAANEYSGGTEFHEGEIHVDSASAIGTGTVTFKTTSKCSMAFNAPNATFANAVVFEAAAANVSDYVVPLVFNENTTMKGAVTGPASGTVYIGIKWRNPADPNAPIVTFDETLDFSKCTLGIRTYGRFVFNGKVLAKGMSMNTAWSASGHVYFNNSDNNLGGGNEVSLYCPYIHCGAPNAISNFQGVLAYNYNANAANGFDLHGFDQTIRRVRINPENDKGYVPPTGGNAGLEITSSGSPATLTLTGPAAEVTTKLYNVFRGNLSVTVDTLPGHIFLLTNRTHTMNGTFAVSNGIVRLSGNTTFTKLSRLVVDSTFDASAANVNPFPAVLESIDIGPNGTLSFPAGSHVQTKALTVNGETYLRGHYSEEDFPDVLSGVVIEQIGDPIEASWTAGAGEDEDVFTAANWSIAHPKFDGFAMYAHFATAGRRAVVNDDVELAGLRLAAAPGETGFTFAGEGTLSLAEKGVVSQGDEARNYVFETPVAAYSPINWLAPTNHSFTFERGFSNDAGAPVVMQGGRYSWSGEGTLADALTVSGGVMTVTGTIATPNHEWPGSVDKNGKGLQLNLTQADWQTGVGRGEKGAVLILSNATVECGVCINCMIGTTPVLVRANTTNEISGFVQHNSGGHGGFYLDAGSETILSGGFADTSAALRLSGTGRMVFRGRPIACTHSLGFNPHQSDVVFEVANNSFNYFALGYDNGATHKAEFKVSNALTNGVFAVGCYWSSPTLKRATGGSTSVEFHSTTQSVEKAAIFQRATLHGDEGALLRVIGAQGTKSGNIAAEWLFVEGDFTGGLGLEMAGTGTLVMTNRAFSSTGPLTVSSGTMDFAANASWRNGTEVTVKGTGVLRIGADRTLGRKAVVRFADSGKLAIPSGVTQRVCVCTVDGEDMPVGAFTYETAPDALKPHLMQGGGTLAICGGGAVLSVR